VEFYQIVVIVSLIGCVGATLRSPFFGALAILMTAVLRDTLYLQTDYYFFDCHGPEILYIATILSAAVARPDRIGEFMPRSMVDWGMLGFYFTLLLSGLVNGVNIWDHKYIDLFFKATLLYFLLSRLADTPGRVTALAGAILVPTAYLAYLAWSKYRSGEVRYARPYIGSSYHDFGLQMVVTLPLIGALLARPFRLPARATLVAVLGLLALLWIEKETYWGFGMMALALCIGAIAGIASSLPVRLALFGLVPLFVLTGLRTQSRSSYLGIFVGLALLAWFHRRRWVMVIVVALPVVAYAVLHQPEAVATRLSSVWTGQVEPGVQDTSLEMRKEQLMTALRVIQSNPVFGLGPRQFFEQYAENVDQSESLGQGWTYTMHSVPLLILCEEGLVGFAIYYGLLVLGSLREATQTLRRTRGDPEMEVVGLAAAGGMMGFLAFLGYSIGQPQMWVINIYGTVALVTAAKRVADARAAELVGQAADSSEAEPAEQRSTEIVFS
jgi:O-antigen ligase